jgi:hypothetical protein
MDQELIFSCGCREDGCAVVESDAQVSPFPVSQRLRSRLKLAGGIGDVVMQECGNRGRDAGPVALMGGDTLPFVRYPGILFGTQGKED